MHTFLRFSNSIISSIFSSLCTEIIPLNKRNFTSGLIGISSSWETGFRTPRRLIHVSSNCCLLTQPGKKIRVIIWPIKDFYILKLNFVCVFLGQNKITGKIEFQKMLKKAYEYLITIIIIIYLKSKYPIQFIRLFYLFLSRNLTYQLY